MTGLHRRCLIWDLRRFRVRRSRPTDAADLADRLAVRPKGWWEHLIFGISAFLGVVIVAGAASADIREPLGLLAILALGLYGLWSGWSDCRRGYGIKGRMMLLQGEATTVAAVISAIVVAVRWLFR